MKTALRDIFSTGRSITKGTGSIDPEDVPKQNLKLVICGDEKTGKSKLFDRIVYDSYTEAYFQTIGSDCQTTIRVVPGACVEVEVWDTAGSSQYRDVLPIFFSNTDIVIVVYDVTNKKSFDSVPGHVADIRNWVGSECDIAILGSKIDSWKNAREVAFNDALQLSQRLGTKCYETSAVTTQGLEDALRKMIKRALKRKRLLPEWLMSTPRDGQEDEFD